ncbi:hypothetical protein HG597_13700 [Klebsiella sp. DNRA6]|nr:hypothetical protein [Klebsiella sp. DNRA6]
MFNDVVDVNGRRFPQRFTAAGAGAGYVMPALTIQAKVWPLG